MSEYHAPKWQNWKTVKTMCNRCASIVFDRVAALEQKRNSGKVQAKL